MPLYGQLDPHRGLVVRENSKQPETAGPDAEVAVLTWENIVHLVRESLDNLHLVASCIANKPIGHAPVGVEMHLVPVDRAMPKKEKEEDGDEFAYAYDVNNVAAIVKRTRQVGITADYVFVGSNTHGSMSASVWRYRSMMYNAIAAHATATLKASVEPTIKAHAEQAGRIARLEDTLREIGKIADKCSTGPVPPDGYWNIYEWVSENVSL